MVSLISKYNKSCKALAIGDGGNDVAMIKAAPVGVAIRGVEGNQAASFADYSILKFKDLRRLLFWHGRNFGSKFGNFTLWFIWKATFLSLP
jgi:phospholipid-transporting ATPase